MTATTLTLILLLVANAPAAWADAPARHHISLTGHYGSARTSFPLADLSRVHGEVRVLTLQARHPLSASLNLEARLAVVNALVGLPAGGATKTTAFANPELALTWRPAPRTSNNLQLALAVAAPLGTGSATARARLSDNQALILAGALTGGTQPGLFTPGRWTATPSIRWAQHWHRFDLHLQAATPLALRFAAPDAHDPAEQSARLGLIGILALGAGARLGANLRVSLDAATAMTALPAARAPGRDTDGITLVLAPRISLPLGRHLRLAAGNIIPVNDGVDPQRLAFTAQAALAF